MVISWQSWPSKTTTNKVFCLGDYYVFTGHFSSEHQAKTIEKSRNNLRRPNLSLGK
jgi:hypothetical protein